MVRIVGVGKRAFIGIWAFLLVSLSHGVPTDFSLTNILPTVVHGTTVVQTSDNRLFITELGGDLKTYKNGTSYTLHHFPTSNARTEQGLFGLAVDPNYATNGWMYVHYFVYVNGADLDYHVIMRFTLSNPLGGNPAYVDGSEYLIYRLPNLPSGNSRHNGGHMVFGNDGYLYMSKGEGEHQEQAEILTNVFGKLIRIDAHSTSASNDDVNGHYGIPPGNPGFAKPEIFAYGFRNPWSMTKDPSSEDIYIGDVGGTEEVNRIIPSQQAGKKFGWGAGGNSGMYNCGDASYVCPMVAYDGGAVTGVAIKRNIGATWPAPYANSVFYSDHNGRWIKYTPVGQNGGTVFDSSGDQPLGLTFGEYDGNLYYCTYNRDGLWMVHYDGVIAVAPSITTQPQPASVHSGHQAGFAVVASGTTLSYQWQSAPTGSLTFTNLGDNAIFGGTTTANLTINATASEEGRYRVVISNSAGTVTSDYAQLTVLPFNASPVITFVSPAQGSNFTVPELINFSATASDAEQGDMPASAFHWDVELGHRVSATNWHTHPITFYDGVKSGSFASTVAGEPSPQVWLLFICSVTDDAGNVTKDTLNVYPNEITLTAQSVPSGLQIVAMDLVTTNVDRQAVIGNTGVINGNTPQFANGYRYDFDHWAFAGNVPAGLTTTDVFQNFIVPSSPATFTAYYNATRIGTSYAFKAVNGQYVSLLSDNRLQANSATIAGNNQVLEVGDNGDATLYIKSLGNGNYCQAVGTADVTCDLASITTNAARWSRVDNSTGTVSFKNLGTNNYLVAENGGASPLKANRGAIGGWEQFTLTVQAPPGPQYAITMGIEAGSGTLTPAVGSVTQVSSGGSLNITAVPAPGWLFLEWHTSAGLTLSSTTSANAQLTNVTMAGSVTAHFVVDPNPPPPATPYAFKAVNGQYVTLLSDTRLQPNSATVAGNNQILEVGNNGDGTVSIKSDGNGLYCEVITATSDVTCDLGSVSSNFAEWTQVDNAGGTTSFKNIGSNGYLVAENGGAAPLKANRANIGGWEQFTLTAQTPPGPQYNITMAIGAGSGSLTPAAGSVASVPSGGNLSVTAFPSSGWTFDHWDVTAGLTIGSTTSANTQLTNVTGNGTVTATFIQSATPPPQAGSLYAFKAVNNLYVTLLSDNRLQATSSTVAGTLQLLEIGNNADGTVYIKANANGLYCEDAVANADVTCDLATGASTAAEWTQVTNATGTLSFKNVVMNGYLVAENGGASPLKANRANIGGWEQFTVTAQTPPGPQYAINMTIAAGQGTLTPAAGTVTQVPEGNSLNISAVPTSAWLFDHWSATAGLTIATPTSSATQLTNVTVGGTVSATFIPNPNPPVGTRYAFKANANSQYVTLLADNRLQANSATVAGNGQLLEVGDNGDGTLYIKALGNGLYCQAVGNADVTCDMSDASATSAKWLQVNNGDGSMSFKNIGTGNHMTAENGGASPLKANRANIAGWEKFFLTAQ